MLQNAISSLETSQSVNAQLGEAGVLMGVGMLSVFLFLSLLIIAMSVLAKIVQRFPGKEVEQLTTSRKRANSEQVSDKPAPEIVAAISAAITQHKRNQ